MISQSPSVTITSNFFLIVGEHCDSHELGRLLQLVLNIAINCDKKQEYIQTIMSMEEDVQQIIKNAIQEVSDVNHTFKVMFIFVSSPNKCNASFPSY